MYSFINKQNVVTGNGDRDSGATLIGSDIHHLATPVDFQKKLKYNLNKQK